MLPGHPHHRYILHNGLFPAGVQPVTISCLQEACTATAAETRLRDLVDNTLWGHLKESLRHSGKSAYGNIFINGLCIDLATVLKNDPCLLVQERNVTGMWTGLIIMTIKQTLNRQSADHGLLYDLATVVYLNMYILDNHRAQFS